MKIRLKKILFCMIFVRIIDLVKKSMLFYKYLKKSIE